MRKIVAVLEVSSKSKIKLKGDAEVAGVFASRETNQQFTNNQNMHVLDLNQSERVGLRAPVGSVIKMTLQRSEDEAAESAATSQFNRSRFQSASLDRRRQPPGQSVSANQIRGAERHPPTEPSYFDPRGSGRRSHNPANTRDRASYPGQYLQQRVETNRFSERRLSQPDADRNYVMPQFNGAHSRQSPSGEPFVGKIHHGNEHLRKQTTTRNIEEINQSATSSHHRAVTSRVESANRNSEISSGRGVSRVTISDEEERCAAARLTPARANRNDFTTNVFNGSARVAQNSEVTIGIEGNFDENKTQAHRQHRASYQRVQTTHPATTTAPVYKQPPHQLRPRDDKNKYYSIHHEQSQVSVALTDEDEFQTHYEVLEALISHKPSVPPPDQLDQADEVAVIPAYGNIGKVFQQLTHGKLPDHVQQKFNIEHSEEEIYDSAPLHHADGSQITKLEDFKNLDTIYELVNLGVEEKRAKVAFQVTCQRLEPVDLRTGVWKKKSVTASRTLNINLDADEEMREVFHKIQDKPGDSIRMIMSRDTNGTSRPTGVKEKHLDARTTGWAVAEMLGKAVPAPGKQKSFVSPSTFAEEVYSQDILEMSNSRRSTALKY